MRIFLLIAFLAVPSAVWSQANLAPAPPIRVPVNDNQAANKAYVDTAFATRAPLAHTHAISDVNGLLMALSSLQPLSSNLTALSNGTITGVGTGANTLAAGNDTRIVGALQAANNLSDLASSATARGNLGLGSVATQAASAVAITGGSVNGTAIGGATPAAGAFTTITATTPIAVASGGTGGSTQATARTGLGLGGAAILNVGATTGTVAAGDDPRITGAVSSIRQISTAGLLTGGGDFSADRTHTVPKASGAEALAGTDDTKAVTSLALASALAPKAPLASPALTGTPTAPTAASGTNTTQIASTGFVSTAIAAIPASAILPVGQARLVYTSTTALTLKPFNGNLVLVGGAYRVVPSAGVGCSNTGLSAGTLYFVYLYMVSSTLTCELVTTGHATSTTDGSEIKSGDATRALVGMVYTASGTPGTFADSATFRGVRSWFNRLPLALRNSVAGSTTSGTDALVSGTVTFALWADESLSTRVSGFLANTAVSTNGTKNYLDGSVFGSTGAVVEPTANYSEPAIAEGLAAPGDLTEGPHTLGVVGSVSAGTGTWTAIQFVSTRG